MTEGWKQAPHHEKAPVAWKRRCDLPPAPLFGIPELGPRTSIFFHRRQKPARRSPSAIRISMGKSTPRQRPSSRYKSHCRWKTFEIPTGRGGLLPAIRRSERKASPVSTAVELPPQPTATANCVDFASSSSPKTITVPTSTAGKCREALPLLEGSHIEAVAFRLGSVFFTNQSATSPRPTAPFQTPIWGRPDYREPFTFVAGQLENALRVPAYLHVP